MFKKPHHRVPGENFLTNLFLPDFQSQNAEAELLLRLEKLQLTHPHDEVITMGSPWPRRRERQVAIMQKPNGHFFKARKWLREENACCSALEPSPRRHVESQTEYTNRRIKELAGDGSAYQSEIRRIKDELRIAKSTIADLVRVVRQLKADCRQEFNDHGAGHGAGVDHERVRLRDRDIEDERLRDLFGDARRRDPRDRQPFEETDFEKRFGAIGREMWG